jgi:hypothetical protein
MFYKLRLPALILSTCFALFLISGCSDDDNPAGGEPSDEDHLRAVGVMLTSGSDTLVIADGTVVTGEVEVLHEASVGPCVVWFLDPDSGWYHPLEEASSSLDDNHTLTIEITDPSVASATLGADVSGGDPWSVTFNGLLAGVTSLRVKIVHNDHPDYTSPLLPLHVEEEHFAAVGVMLIQGADTLFIVNGSQITGQFSAPLNAESPLTEVWFLDPDGDWIRPAGGHEDGLDEEGTALAVEVENTGMITITLGVNIPGNEDAWSFTATGEEIGTTRIRILAVHEDHPDYTSPWIPAVVTP